MLRKLFEPKREKVTGDWINLHDDERHNLLSSLNTVSVIKARKETWSGHVEHKKEYKNAFVVLIGKPEGKKLF